MKPIEQMNLAECISVVRQLTPDELQHDIQWRVGARIEELTRWIPVSERMPTEADADQYGEVVWLYREDGAVIAGWGVYRDSKYCTHWKRITTPEDT